MTSRTRWAALVGAVALGLVAGGCPGKKVRHGRDGGPSVVVRNGGETAGVLADEKEPNDDAASAQVIALGVDGKGGVRGRIDKAGDVDVYTVAASARGTLSVRLSGVDDADLVLELADGAGKTLVTSDAGPAKSPEGVPDWTVDPGSYRLTVREFVKKPAGKPGKGKGAPAPAAPAAPAARTAPSQPYALEVTLGPAPGPGDEVEPNDTAAFAGDLPLGTAGSGYLGWRKDRDVWKVPLGTAGDDSALSVDVDAIPGVALRVAVLDGTEATLLERQGRPGEPVALRNVAVRAGEPHYYLAISGDKASLDARYTVRAQAVPFQLDEEAEPNDTVETASPLSDVPNADGGTRVGFLGRGDVDVYKLDPSPATRALHVTVEPPAGVDAELAILGPDKAPLGAPVDPGKPGAPAHLDGVVIPANQPAWVRVTAKKGASDTERYRLRWSAVPAEAPVPVPGVDDE